MSVLEIVLVAGVLIYLVVKVHILQKEIRDLTSFTTEDAIDGGKTIKNAKGEIIFEL